MAKLALFSIAMFAAAIGNSQAQSPPAPNDLTGAQKQMLTAAEADLAAKIAPLAEKVGQSAKALDRALLADKPDPALERKLGDEFADAVSQIVVGAIRLRVAALHDIVATLTPEQKKLLLAELDKPGTDPDLLELMKKVFAEKKK
jgi:Spy/CpxP family protein refolding chaperone